MEPQLNVSVLDSGEIIKRAVFNVNIQSICFTEKLVVLTSIWSKLLSRISVFMKYICNLKSKALPCYPF